MESFGSRLFLAFAMTRALKKSRCRGLAIIGISLMFNEE